MKDLGKVQYVLGIKIIRDRKNKIIALSQEIVLILYCLSTTCDRCNLQMLNHHYFPIMHMFLMKLQRYLMSI